ncbi:enoyl-CoA hydratase-like protein [Myriangium duriaei CBS 260.36]|uniref:Enoyl-CoA hydratase-like protein n=1 Tax=Myriangium duriaei CBS 260.36 TaxID=1168546 RepID=A0A9P4J9E5_9PEZI|nr:enoyl-CoA hydratase-like protein [Myriangium duriaei CBS 260.36]
MGFSTDTQPPPTPTYLLSYPAEHVLLITINRPKQMNSLPFSSHWEADALLSWFDSEPQLRVAVVTGGGDRAFCAGQDLIEQDQIAKEFRKGTPRPAQMTRHPPGGFMAISRRQGKKPVIAAVNGWAMGGGFEIVLGCDMVVAAPKAVFALPEASRGLYAAAGGLSRLVRVVGKMVASEIAMAGRKLSAEEAVRYHVANKVSKTNESVVPEAIELAKSIAGLSPDAIIVTRQGLLDSWEVGSVERATQLTEERYGPQLRRSQNLSIGLAAFAAKKAPQWVPSKL